MPNMFEYSEPVNTVTDVLTETTAYYLNASYYQYMLNLHKHQVTSKAYFKKPFKISESRLSTLPSNTNSPAIKERKTMESNPSKNKGTVLVETDSSGGSISE
ncbi:hypothetical protein NQ318_010127 [Aromia moschata]|uniref:Uncharacterized protein n=1 Tax=Aromia moschata TaxID=1265417 RepID=A0AAV8Y4L1_9CUCU|nr:hypothetical protein NQ318_010127 [Aromia moschata]